MTAARAADYLDRKLTCAKDLRSSQYTREDSHGEQVRERALIRSCVNSEVGAGRLAPFPSFYGAPERLLLPTGC